MNYKMKCNYCERHAFYLFFPNNISLCPAHLNQHFTNENNSNFEGYFVTLEPFEKKLLNDELKTRISSLKALKSHFRSQTKMILKKLEKFYNSTMKKIDELLEVYKEISQRTVFPHSEIEEIRKLIQTNIILTQPDPNNLYREVESFYSKTFLRFENDSAKESSFIMKNLFKSYNGGLNCLDISKDGKILITGSEDTTLRVWDVKNMKQIGYYAEHTGNVGCVALSNDCSSALSGSYDKSVILWDLVNKCSKKVFLGHTGTVLSVSFSQDQKLIISGSFRKEIFLWKIETGECLKKINTSDKICFVLLVSENECLSATNTQLEKWDLTNSKIIYSKNAHNKEISSIAASKNNQFIITGSSDCSVKVWNAASMSIYASHSEHRDIVNSVSFASNDENIVSGSQDFQIILWSLSKRKSLHKFDFHRSHIYGVKSVDDKIFSVSRDTRIGISRISTLKKETFLSLKPFQAGSEVIKGNLVAFGSMENVVVCDTSKGKEVILRGHTSIVHHVCLSSNSEFLISSSIENMKNLIVWDLKQESMISELAGHDTSVFCVDISSDDCNALSGDAHGKLIYWDLQTLMNEYLVQGHSGHVYSVKISNNKNFAVSGGEDKDLNIWNLKEKSNYAKLKGHTQIIWKVCITRDDKYAVSADVAEGIRVWNIKDKIQIYLFTTLEESKIWLNDYKELKGQLLKYLP